MLVSEEIEVKLKKCSKCGEEFPENTDYYFKRKGNKDGLNTKCKMCQGYNFTNKLTNIPKEGYKFCIKCNRELPIDIKYFPPDKMCKTGLRNVCRECGEDGHFMEDGYEVKHFWTIEEEELLKNIYPHYLNEEIILLYFPNESLKSLINKAYKLGNINKTKETMERQYKLQSERYSGENNYNYGKHKSEEVKIKISLAKKGKFLGEDNWWYGKKRSEKQIKQISLRRKGLWSGDKNPRHINPLNGELNGRWQGGIKQLYYDLRDHLQEWKKSSMQECNYKCVLTNGEFDNVHHLYNFKDIVYEIFEKLNLPIHQTIGEYSEDERNDIYKLLNELHTLYGNGKCICKPLHKLFHDTYRYTKNTSEQFYEFEKRYKNFEFDELLNDKYKYCNVLKSNI